MSKEKERQRGNRRKEFLQGERQTFFLNTSVFEVEYSGQVLIMLTAYQSQSYLTDTFQTSLYDQNSYEDFNSHGQNHQSHFQMQNGYHMGQAYQGWSGVSLKQIMGQIDLLSNANQTSHHWNSKWNVSKENNAKTCFPNAGNYPAKATSSDTTLTEFKDNLMGMDIIKEGQGSDANSAWLGPHLWNRKFGVDFKSSQVRKKGYIL